MNSSSIHPFSTTVMIFSVSCSHGEICRKWPKKQIKRGDHTRLKHLRRRDGRRRVHENPNFQNPIAAVNGKPLALAILFPRVCLTPTPTFPRELRVSRCHRRAAHLRETIELTLHGKAVRLTFIYTVNSSF